VHCTDQLAADFIGRIRASPYGNDTLVVVASDHLAMRNTASGRLNALPDRRRLTFFVSAPDQTGARNQAAGLHYDIAPTVLDLLGIEINGQLGLGRSLLHQDGYLASRVGIETAVNARPDGKLGRHIAGLWSLDSMTIEGGLSVNLASGSVAFGGRTFDLMTKRGTSLLPTLFSFDPHDFRLTGLYQADPGKREPDELTERLLKNRNSLQLAIGPHRSLESLAEGHEADNTIRSISATPENIGEDDIVIFVGKPGTDGIIARPSSGSFDISGSEIARLAR
jgi:hypothetical protein